MVADVNDMRAEGVQDNGKGYDKVLNGLSAKKVRLNQGGEVELIILKLLHYYKCMSIQIFENI